MKIFKLKSWALMLIAVSLMILSASGNNAHAGLKIEVKPGHHDKINGKTFCVDFGICEVTITLNDHVIWGTGGSDFVSYPVKSEIKDGVMQLTFPQRLDAKFMYPESSYTFPVSEDIEFKGQAAKDFGFKQFTIRKGDYKFDGQVLNIKLSDIKPLDRQNKNSGTN